MLYNKVDLPGAAYTAGKITILTALTGVAVFMMAFVFDFGAQELSKVSAQTATTTLTVLNTPPSFTVNAYETVESSTTTPTNSFSVINWAARGNDSNGAPYFLLICSTNATPTANSATSTGNLGTQPPACNASSTQWGVSAATPSDSLATVSRTTNESAPFAEVNNWYAWVCDDDPFNPRCNTTPVQGFSATNSSPFHVNFRPVLTSVGNNGPVDPGGTLNFTTVATDPDTVGGEDNLTLVVCQTNTDYNTTTNTCASNFLASTTVPVTANPGASYALASIVRDDTYPAFGYLVDQHGHEAAANPISSNFIVNNVAPTVLSSNISLNGGNDLTLTVEAGETAGFTLDFTVTDSNSCVNASSGSEITGYVASVYRSSILSCDGTAGSYNANNCYPSGAASAWALTCTASTTSCTGPTDDSLLFNCSFPLWFIADPTDPGTNVPASFSADNWVAAVAGRDDNALTGTSTVGAIPVELISFLSIDLLTSAIPYGALEPGDNTGTLNATTTIRSTGNTGIDQTVLGESMCGTFAVGNECPVSASSTVPETEQRFSSTSLSYVSPFAVQLSSSTVNEVELDVLKTTSTSTPNQGVTYWGIAVPISITLAGSYQGLNTFYGVVAEAADWF